MHDNDITMNWPDAPHAALRRAVTSIQSVAFWTAVLIPFAYVPLLVTGLSTLGEGLLMAQLVTVNAVALVLGHDHAEDIPVGPD
jgi:hypothetical protein